MTEAEWNMYAELHATARAARIREEVAASVAQGDAAPDADAVKEQAKNILARAAEVLSEHGWIQGSLHSSEGRHCALGAIDEASAEMDRQSRFASSHIALVEITAENMLHRAVPYSDVPTWNDDPSRTAEDVILMLKRVAYDC